MKKIMIFGLFLFCFPMVVHAKTVEVSFKKCVDGDTARFVIGNQEKSVRFLAINTPEIKHGNKKAEPYGVAASKYTCDQLKNAKKIELEYDSASDKQDKYGRVLAWVFVDGVLLQKELVKHGYAEVKYLYGNYKYTDELQRAEKKARREQLNIWSTEEKKTEEQEELIDRILDKLFKYIRKQIKSML